MTCKTTARQMLRQKIATPNLIMAVRRLSAATTPPDTVASGCADGSYAADVSSDCVVCPAVRGAALLPVLAGRKRQPHPQP